MAKKYNVGILGARMHYAVPLILHSAGMLECFYTDITSSEGWPRFFQYVPEFMMSDSMARLKARVLDIPSGEIRSFPSFGIDYAQKLSQCRNEEQRTAIYLWAGKKFCELMMDAGFKEADGLYVCNSAGLEAMKAAKLKNIRCVVEQTIAPKRIEMDILTEERKKYPDWEDTGNRYCAEYIEREAMEWDEADTIICGSEFVKEGIRKSGGPEKKCVVVPYGIKVPTDIRPKEKRNGLLRVLFAGSFGLRKGAQYLMQSALNLKGKAEFRCVGGVGVPQDIIRKMPDNMEIMGPVSREEMKNHYEWADIFVLPSLCEGSATVTYEALAYGLPVVCTPNTGSVVKDGETGYIAPACNSDAITEKIIILADKPEMVSTMSGNAIRKSKDITLEAYGARLVEALR